MVFPVINAAPNLPCTCTLLWLLKNKDLYRGDRADGLETESTRNCLMSQNFDQMIEECRFDSKITECKAITTTTTNVSPITNVPTISIYNPWQTIGILFIIFTVCLVFIIVLLILFPRYVNLIRQKVKLGSKTNTETFSFETIAEE